MPQGSKRRRTARGRKRHLKRTVQKIGFIAAVVLIPLIASVCIAYFLNLDRDETPTVSVPAE